MQAGEQAPGADKIGQRFFHTPPVAEATAEEIPEGIGKRESSRDVSIVRVAPAEHIAERCLAHVIGGQVERAYDRADYLDQRREVMERFERVRLLAFAPRTHRLDDGEERIVFTAGVTDGGVSVVCDGTLRPLLVTATDALVGVVRAWDDWPEGPETFPGQAWLDDWLAGARWSELGPDSVSDGPVAGR